MKSDLNVILSLLSEHPTAYAPMFERVWELHTPGLSLLWEPLRKQARYRRQTARILGRLLSAFPGSLLWHDDDPNSYFGLDGAWERDAGGCWVVPADVRLSQLDRYFTVGDWSLFSSKRPLRSEQANAIHGYLLYVGRRGESYKLKAKDRKYEDQVAAVVAENGVSYFVASEKDDIGWVVGINSR